MKTKSTLLVVLFTLLLAKFSAKAQCTVTITGKKELGSPLRAKTGDCHIEMLTWQLNGKTVYVAYQTQFKRKGTVVAGGNEYGSASNQLAAPEDVHVDDAGNIYVLDGNNNRVQKWIPGATSGETVAGGHGLGSAANQFFLPQGFFVDKTGTIYVADLFNNRVQKWTPGAVAGVTVAGGNGYGSGAQQLASPKDVFVDAVGNVFVTDADNNRVQRWAPGATMGVTVAGGNGYGSNANQLKNPFSLFVDEAGSVYISDRTNNRIQKWAAGSSTGITVAAGINGSGEDSSQLNDPRGLFVDTYGRIYISDYFNNRIQKWVPGMNYGLTIAGGRGIGETSGRLNHPSGVYMSADGDLYVTDEGNNRVEKYAAVNSIRDRIIPNVPGKYRVIAVCSNGLVDTSAEVEIGTGLALQATPSVETLNKKADQQLTVFPNPAIEFTTLKYTAAKQDKVIVQITDISGKVVIRKAYTSSIGENQLKIDVSKLTRGNYIINVINENTTQTAKLNKL